MQDISSSLLSAQKYEQYITDASSNNQYVRIPYVELVFHSKDNSITYDYSDRMLGMEMRTMLDSGSATITLRNDDSLIGRGDLKGYWIEAVIGDKFFDSTGAITGCEGYPKPRLWVKQQYNTSAPNSKYVILKLEGQWELLGEDLCLIKTTSDSEGITLAPYHSVVFIGATVHHILYWILLQAGMYLPYPELPSDDGLISKTLPEFFINKALINEHWNPTSGIETRIIEPQYETDKEVVDKLIGYTYSYLRAIPNIWNYVNPEGWSMPCFEIVYPEPEKGERNADETYYSDAQPIFYEFAYMRGLTIPNNILVYGDIDEETGLFNEGFPIGHAQDDESIEAYGTPSHDNPAGKITKIYIEGSLRTQEDVDDVAGAKLSKFQAAASGGRILTPYDARVQLLDLVEVYDSR